MSFYIETGGLAGWYHTHEHTHTCRQTDRLSLIHTNTHTNMSSEKPMIKCDIDLKTLVQQKKKIKLYVGIYWQVA